MPQVPEARSRPSHRPREPIDIPSQPISGEGYPSIILQVDRRSRRSSDFRLYPNVHTEKKLINEFLRLIYDHKSMLIDTVEQSYR